MSDVYTFTPGNESNFLSTGCFYLYDTINTMSQFGNDVFKNIPCSILDEYTVVAQSGDFTKVTVDTGSAQVYTPGNLFVICDGDHKMAGVHHILTNPSSGVLSIDLPWESCFSTEPTAEFYITAATKVGAGAGQSIIGDEVCISSNLNEQDHRFVQYTSVAYTNCIQSDPATRCSTTATVTTFSGDNSIDTHEIGFVQGVCPPVIA